MISKTFAKSFLLCICFTSDEFDDLFGLEGPTSSYVTADIIYQVIRILKHLHPTKDAFDEAEIPAKKTKNFESAKIFKQNLTNLLVG